MKKSATEKLRLGIFVVTGTVLLVSALYFIGNRQNLFTPNFVIYSYFTNVNGLQSGNNVRFSGINVGTVGATEILSDTLIRVEMRIQQKMSKIIRKNAVATIGSDGLVGSMIINIIPSSGPAKLVTSGDVIQSYSKIGVNDMLTTLNVTNENAALLTSDLLKITSNINKGKGTLGMLITDSTLAGDLKKTILLLKESGEGASTAISTLNTMLAEVNFSESMAGVWLSDTVSAMKMKNILTHLEASSSDINRITRSLDTLTSAIKNGSGALHYLTQDPNLVREIDSTLQNIKSGTARFNENMEALKHHFLFRGYFRKMEREQKKALKNKEEN